MMNPWTWFKNLFRPKAAKKNEKTVRDVKQLRSFPSVPSSSLYDRSRGDLAGDVLDVVSTVLIVDAVTDLVGRSESVDIPPQPQEVFHEQVYPNVVAIPDPPPVFNDVSSTTFNDTSSYSFISITPAAVEGDSTLNVLFTGIGDAISGLGDAIGDALSD